MLDADHSKEHELTGKVENIWRRENILLCYKPLKQS